MNTLRNLVECKNREAELRVKIARCDEVDASVFRAALRFVAVRRRLLERMAGIGKDML